MISKKSTSLCFLLCCSSWLAAETRASTAAELMVLLVAGKGGGGEAGQLHDWRFWFWSQQKAESLLQVLELLLSVGDICFQSKTPRSTDGAVVVLSQCTVEAEEITDPPFVIEVVEWDLWAKGGRLLWLEEEEDEEDVPRPIVKENSKHVASVPRWKWKERKKNYPEVSIQNEWLVMVYQHSFLHQWWICEEDKRIVSFVKNQNHVLVAYYELY